MRRRAQWLLVGFVALFVAAGLAAGGRETPAQEKITFRMNWYWGGIHAPFVLAKERGYFEKEGLNVEIAEGKGSATTVQLVGTKADTFGWADGSTIALNLAKGVPVKAVATILNVLPYAVVSLDEKNIRTAKDLEGKSLAITPGDGLTQTWPAVVAANKLDASKIKLVHVAPQAKIPAVTEKQVDALLGGADDQAISIEAKGMKTRALKFGDLGVPLIGFAILAHQDTIKDRPDLVRKVVAASLEGVAGRPEGPRRGGGGGEEDRPPGGRRRREEAAPRRPVPRLQPGQHPEAPRLGPPRRLAIHHRPPQAVPRPRRHPARDGLLHQRIPAVDGVRPFNLDNLRQVVRGRQVVREC